MQTQPTAPGIDKFQQFRRFGLLSSWVLKLPFSATRRFSLFWSRPRHQHPRAAAFYEKSILAAQIKQIHANKPAFSLAFDPRHAPLDQSVSHLLAVSKRFQNKKSAGNARPKQTR
jgi:hypothetical protein